MRDDIDDGIATIRLGRRGAAPTPREKETDAWRSVLARLRLRFRRWRVRPAELEPGRWWNGSLRSVDQLATAAERARAARLPLCGDRDRDWDALEALELILDETDPSARIADIGLRGYEPLLRWLEVLQHGRIQPSQAVRIRANRILAVSGGRTGKAGGEAPASPEPYDAVICRSLPGDRIRLLDRLDQASSMLRPGGVFVLSSEFWDMPDPYQGSERRCARDHLCCRRRADGLSREALDRGLVPVAPVFLGETPEPEHPDLLGVGVSPIKLAFRKRAEREPSGPGRDDRVASGPDA